jgi:Ca2+/Na+ antiporter
VTYSANQTLNAPPNQLAGESMPNTLGGVGVAGAVSPLQSRWSLTAAVTGVVLAVLALVLLLVWRA